MKGPVKLAALAVAGLAGWSILRRRRRPGSAASSSGPPDITLPPPPKPGEGSPLDGGGVNTPSLPGPLPDYVPLELEQLEYIPMQGAPYFPHVHGGFSSSITLGQVRNGASGQFGLAGAPNAPTESDVYAGHYHWLHLTDEQREQLSLGNQVDAYVTTGFNKSPDLPAVEYDHYHRVRVKAAS